MKYEIKKPIKERIKYFFLMIIIWLLIIIMALLPFILIGLYTWCVYALAYWEGQTACEIVLNNSII